MKLLFILEIFIFSKIYFICGVVAFKMVKLKILEKFKILTTLGAVLS